MTFLKTTRAIVAGLILGTAFTLAARADQLPFPTAEERAAQVAAYINDFGNGIHLTNSEMSNIINSTLIANGAPGCAASPLRGSEGRYMWDWSQRMIRFNGYPNDCEVSGVICLAYVRNGADAAARTLTMNCDAIQPGKNIKIRNARIQL